MELPSKRDMLSWITTLLFFVLLPISVAGQEESVPNAFVTFVAVDCSASDQSDPTNCAPLQGVAFDIRHVDGTTGDETTERRVTDVAGFIVVAVVAPSTEYVIYLNETDLGLEYQPNFDYIEVEPGDDGVVYLFFDAPSEVPDDGEDVVSLPDTGMGGTYHGPVSLMPLVVLIVGLFMASCTVVLRRGNRDVIQ